MAPCIKCGANLAYGDIIECPFDPSCAAIQCQQCGTIHPIDEDGTIIDKDVDSKFIEEEFNPAYVVVNNGRL